MRSIIWKPRQTSTSPAGAEAPATRNPFAAYASEYRRAMLATREVERLSGHLDRAALLLKQGYTVPDR